MGLYLMVLWFFHPLPRLNMFLLVEFGFSADSDLQLLWQCALSRQIHIARCFLFFAAQSSWIFRRDPWHFVPWNISMCKLGGRALPALLGLSSVCAPRSLGRVWSREALPRLSNRSTFNLVFSSAVGRRRHLKKTSESVWDDTCLRTLFPFG